ncbi:hypothetical protein BBM40_13460 [Vibrio parahaemolyticus]|nr:hypothetical protein [Vibrio parahaemolyticus]ELA7191456.1 hypothetical protein [Vibrio alginolyticus]EHW0696159.1 hypothetical protein [Vibrio parahaemolyticus]EIU6803926.1 hypothetical protein [Vibrio parahaemolyticus]EJA7342630.1 hypothetical protein [Vibrio parahaemolyticus]EJG0622556.1 hypothetical protein [Vibrio parahaemolyticus]
MIDFFQNLRLTELDDKYAQNKVRTQTHESHLRVLEEKIDSLYILTLASLELLNEQGVSNKQIMNKIEEIDLRDGKKDGKLAPISHCNDCGHKISKRRTHCFYCGAAINKFDVKF